MGRNLIDEISDICARRVPFHGAIQEICRALRAGLPHYNWVGIYMLEEEGRTLVLRAWDGPAATEHVRIPVGEGICGLAAREKQTVVVDDVRKDTRYLQCFLHTRAEIVVPIFAGGKVVGEIDIDSDKVAVFNSTDRMFLECCATWIGKAFEKGEAS